MLAARIFFVRTTFPCRSGPVAPRCDPARMAKAKKTNPRPTAAPISTAGGLPAVASPAQPLTTTGELDASAKKVPVLITEELKAAAGEVDDSWAETDVEEVGVHQLHHVILHYQTIEAAQEALVHLDALFRKLDRNFPTLNPLRTSIPSVSIFWEHFLPPAFSLLAGTVAQTELDVLKVNEVLLEAGDLYRAAFDQQQVVTAEIAYPETGCAPAARDCGQAILATQRKLVRFLRLLPQARDRGSWHIVHIDRDFTFKLDGKKFRPQSAATRALLALCLLRKKESFSVNEFATLYAGGNAGAANRSFDNAMNALKKAGLKRLGWRAPRNTREMSGIIWRVDPPRAAIKDELAERRI
jgi:hypothetical protein